MEGDDGDLHVDDDLMESPEDEGGGQEHGQQEQHYARFLGGGGGAPGGSDPPKQRRNRKPTGWYDAMRDLTEPGADGVVPPRPSDEALEAVNAAHGLGRVTLRQAREYVTEKRKTLARRGARQEAKEGGAANGGDSSGGYLGVIKRGDNFYSNVYNPVDGQFYPACMLGVATAEEAARLHDAKVLELGLPPTELNFPPPGVLRREVPVIPVKQVAQPAAGNGGGGGAAKRMDEQPALDADGKPVKRPRGRPPGFKSQKKVATEDGPPPGFGAAWEVDGGEVEAHYDVQQPARAAEPPAPLPPPPPPPLDVYTSVEAFLRGVVPPLRDCDATVAASARSGYTCAHFHVVHDTMLNESLPTAVRHDIMARLCAALELELAADQTALHVAFTKACFQEPQAGGEDGAPAGGDAAE